MSITDSNEKDLETLCPTEIELVLAGKTFVVKPFVLKNRIKAVKIIIGIFKDIAPEITESTKSNPVSIIPILIESAGERLIDLYALVLEKEKDWLLEQTITLKDEVALLTAIFSVNDVPFIVRRIQEALPKGMLDQLIKKSA